MPQPRRRRQVLLACLATLSVAGEASAHAIVTASEPAAGAVLDALPARISVQFNSRIDPERSRLTLIGPDGASQALDITHSNGLARLEAPAPASRLAPGAWRLRWQVLAMDGHITRGDIPFTIRAP